MSPTRNLVITLIMVCVLTALWSLSPMNARAEGTEEGCDFKVQCISLTNPGDAVGLVGTSCAPLLADFIRSGYKIASITALVGPPGALYTLVNHMGPFGEVALIKCGKAGLHGEDDSDCGGSGSDGGCDTH